MVCSRIVLIKNKGKEHHVPYNKVSYHSSLGKDSSTAQLAPACTLSTLFAQARHANGPQPTGTKHESFPLQ